MRQRDFAARTKLARRTDICPSARSCSSRASNIRCRRSCASATGRAAGRDGCLITSGDLGAVELDNEVFARASKIAPIDIPPDVADVGEQRGVGDRRGLDLQSRNLSNDWSNRLEPVARPVRAADLALDGVLRLQDSRVQPRPYQRSDHVPLSRRVDGSGRDGRPRCCVRALLSTCCRRPSVGRTASPWSNCNRRCRHTQPVRESILRRHGSTDCLVGRSPLIGVHSCSLIAYSSRVALN